MSNLKIEQCSICLTDIDNSSFVNLKCNHKFHLKCYIEMAVRCSSNENCPNCRAKIEKINLIDKIKNEKIKNKVDIEHLELRCSVANQENQFLREEVDDLRGSIEKTYKKSRQYIAKIQKIQKELKSQESLINQLLSKE